MAAPALSPSLNQQLSRLEQANLIRLVASQPEIEYIFRHALIQESAYFTLVRADRRRVHRAVGEAIEALSAGSDPSPEVALQLARHFEVATDDARALRYYTQAGDAALSRYANTEAIAAFSRALAAAERCAARAAEWQHLFTARGRALELNSQFDEALANYEQMSGRAESFGDRHLALAASVAAGQLFATATPLLDPARAEQMADAALAEARDLGDEAVEANILWNRVNLYRFTHRLAQARLAGELSLEIARRLNLKSQAALTLNDLVHVYSDLTLWPEALKASTEVERLWRELGNVAMLADCLSTSALCRGVLGDLTNTVKQAEEAYRLSVSIGNLWGQSYACSAMSEALWYLGQPDRAIETAQECIRVGRLAGYLVPEVFDRLRLAYMYAELGNIDFAFELLHLASGGSETYSGASYGSVRAVQTLLELLTGHVEQAAATLAAMEAEMLDPIIWEVDPILRARSGVALAQGNPAHALEVSQANVTRLREQGLLLLLPNALIHLARALVSLGRVPEAREKLLEAKTRAEAMGAPMLDWAVLYELGKLELEHGDPAATEPYWARARQLVTAIAERVPTPELRLSFLARSDLQELFGTPAPRHPSVPVGTASGGTGL